MAREGMELRREPLDSHAARRLSCLSIQKIDTAGHHVHRVTKHFSPYMVYGRKGLGMGVWIGGLGGLGSGVRRGQREQLRGMERT